MPGTRLLPLAGFLIALVVSGVLARADDARIVSPEPGAILLGSTVLRLETDPDAKIDLIDVYVNGQLVGSASEPDWTVVWEAESIVATFKVLAVAYSGNEVAAKARREFRGAVFHQYERVDLESLAQLGAAPEVGDGHDAPRFEEGQPGWAVEGGEVDGEAAVAVELDRPR